ncbi:hypothetical protein PTKIN_Ptkin09bG0174600 [Pterospermum kingtungense]
MDAFDVLTERYGLKPQGKSAPMSQAKRSTTTAAATATATTDSNFGFESGLTRNSTSFSSKPSRSSSASYSSLLDDGDSFSNQNSQNSFGLTDDYGYQFGGFENPTNKQSNTSNNSRNGSSFDLNSIFLNSDPKSDDIFGGLPGSQNASSDLLGDFSGVAVKLRNSGSWDSGKNEAYGDDLIPGFGGSTPPVNRTNIKASESTFKSTEEPFVVLESDSDSEYNSSKAPSEPLEEFSMFNQAGGTKAPSSSNASTSLRHPPKPAQVLKADEVKTTSASLIDELEDFAMGGVHNKASRSKEAEDAAKMTQKDREDDLESFFGASSRSNSAPKSRATTELEDFAMGGVHNKASRSKEAEHAARKTQQNREDDMESFFGGSSRSNSAPKSRETTLDPLFEFDANTHNRQQKTSTEALSTAKKASSAATRNEIDDLSFIFGGAPMFGEFEEISGESEERRRARLGRHQRTQDRVARAVADMNQRDRQTQNEQEERRRIAEAVDIEIKRWAAGKEANMRALLSSLQLVLWSECGWEPVSLTDLITSGSVKKVYRKATLCVHPDKVQQKGATLEQKYIAEKVFDILKEAWNKFNKEELS